jgi:hypothetical protein
VRRALANYVCEVAPEIAGHCEYWQTNEGDRILKGAKAGDEQPIGPNRARNPTIRKCRLIVMECA